MTIALPADDAVALPETAQLVLDTIARKPTKGIPVRTINPMEWRMIDRMAGEPEGTYERCPVPTYRKMLINAGCCTVDQWIPTNPLSMCSRGYNADKELSATTGKKDILLDGIIIDSPEAVAEHLERFVFPSLEAKIKSFDAEARIAHIIEGERSIQEELTPALLKVPYGYVIFPFFRYGEYGYEHYFMAYALYPELMEKDFALQAEAAFINNQAVAYRRGSLPPLIRLDHDMADSRGTLVDIKSLDAIWFPHFARCIEPVGRAGIKMIWHSDGNLWAMVPRLLEAGLHGFQGFQYEDGMDYEAICKMTTREGDSLIIAGGVSVTRTLPYGTPGDVRRELDWLVSNGPRTGLFLGASSSITPGVPWENFLALIEGFHYYREHGRP